MLRGGHTVYELPVGVLMLDTKFPRLLGDIGNARTWPFPVLYRVVRGAIPERLAVSEPDPALLEPMIDTVLDLEAGGVRAILTSCGFLAAYQPRLAAAVSVPVFTSALLQVPMAAQCIQPGQRVAIVTARTVLNDQHFAGTGWSAADIQVVQVAPPDDGPFAATFVGNAPEYEPAEVRTEVAELIRSMLTRHPEVGAIVLECANLAPFSQTVREISGLPVFDLYTLGMHAYLATSGPDMLRTQPAFG
jgi:hypothetical protein